MHRPGSPAVLLFLALVAVCGAGCSGGGGFSQGVTGKVIGNGKKDSASNNNNNGGQQTPPPKDSGSPSPDDKADQPEQITGTYLTCSDAETKGPGHAAYGCRIASKTDSHTVALSKFASTWQWQVGLPGGAPGTVTVREQPGSEQQAIYEFTAADENALKALMGLAHVVLNLSLKGGVYGSGNYSFNEPIATALVAGPGTSNGALGNYSPTPNKLSPVNGGGAPASGGAGSGPTGVSTLGGGADTGTGTDTSGQTAGDQPTGGSGGGTGTGTGTATTASGVTPPTITFTLKSRKNSFGLVANVPDTDVTDLQITGAGQASIDNTIIQSDGTARLEWSAPLSVTLKKAGHVCTGNGTIGTGALSLPLTCQ